MLSDLPIEIFVVCEIYILNNAGYEEDDLAVRKIDLFIHYLKNHRERGSFMGRMLILWLLGVPIGVLILLKILGII